MRSHPARAEPVGGQLQVGMYSHTDGGGGRKVSDLDLLSLERGHGQAGEIRSEIDSASGKQTQGWG